jgi:hypothetical protein
MSKVPSATLPPTATRQTRPCEPSSRRPAAA